ncbi:hypothetical protein VHEMI04310 [[Torrubiella] hemipterigena]|uniref:Major facilitator superfamily (MFS) profile domain-containing protein n=1 Tax=[Torrubiella] hemipterigena TaxID=1531966 RepID=A0A0A1T0V8_9HYPO|nr:hypothetical protein VHEMI04310 [[Torrubiella] hemipterigena]
MTSSEKTSMEKTMTDGGDVVVQTVSQAEIEKTETVPLPVWTPEEEQRLVKKIDRHLMPLLLFSYALQFFDKTTLGYTAILGIQHDTNLHGTDFSWVSSIFYFGYLIASYPASLALVKFPIGKFLTVCVIIWAVVLGAHAGGQNFGGLMALRFILGVFESSISPGFSLVTTLWYKPSEHASRHGIWFAGNTSASVVGGLLAYAISHIKTNIAAWRWLFIIFALVTFFWGIILLIFLPDTPLNARFLTPEERVYAHRRPQQKTRSFKTNEWKKDQFFEALKDPKTWLLFFFTICTCIPNGGYTSFNSLIIQGFGFDTLTTLLLGMPGSAFGLFFVLSSTYFVHRVKYSRCAVMAAMQIVSLIGCVMVYATPTDHKWTRLGGIWLFPAYSAAFPISLSIIGSDIAGYTKKTTVLAILFIGYCAGNIAGPQLFLTKEAPRYNTAFQGILVCISAATVIILVLRQYMAWENKRRDRAQGVHIDPELEKEDPDSHLVRDGVDETDWQNKKFRYYL